MSRIENLDNLRNLKVGHCVLQLEKYIELKLKRNEHSMRFDELTKRFNVKLKETTSKIAKLLQTLDQDENSRRRTLIISIRNIQSMIIEGYEVYSGKNDFESKLKWTKHNYLELIVPKMPLSWLDQPFREDYYDTHVDNFMHKLSNERNEKYLSALHNNLQEFYQKDSGNDVFSLMKIEMFVNNLWRNILSEEELKVLDLTMIELFEKNVYANYFLAYINYKIAESGNSQMKVSSQGFVQLKDKFLKILSGMIVIIKVLTPTTSD